MSRRPSPLREWENARKAHAAAIRAYYLAPTILHQAIASALHDVAHVALRKARVRLVLSALAHLVAAGIIIGVLYALIVLMWAAFGAEPAPDVTNVQLPTL